MNNVIYWDIRKIKASEGKLLVVLNNNEYKVYKNIH